MKKLLAISLLSMPGSGVSFADDTQYLFRVDGPACPFRADNIEKNVGKLDSVKDVKANLEEGLVRVIVADGKRLREEIVRQTITDAGLILTSIESHAMVRRRSTVN